MASVQQPIESYYAQQTIYTVEVERRLKQHRTISWSRLAIMVLTLTFGYFAISAQSPLFWGLAGFCFVGFLVLMNIHSRTGKQLQLAKTLLLLNEQEIAFLEKNELPFADGLKFQEPHHPYSYDLDLFGPQSLYHHLNRTGTIMGSAELAQVLQHRSSNETITGRQQAVRELAPLLGWRQDFMAKGRLANDSEKIVNELRTWTTENEQIPAAIQILRFVLPVCGFLLTVSFAFTLNQLLANLVGTIFVFNLILLGSQIKKMNREIGHADRINETLLRYSELLHKVETENWTSPFMQQVKNRLSTSGHTASQEIHRLSRIFASLESLQNGFGAIVFNGTLLYHVHAYRNLVHWKNKHALELNNWLDTIAELEMLLSFANLAYNNPDFCYPELNTENKMQFEALGHPLISASKRITNSVDFSEKGFIILTGSNMSGKSTFLRTLGVNLVLANAGSPICAEKANIHPMDILVSMRLTDSLADSESYFFAEVKRLKEIMSGLENKRCFILLDEILRGTNSDDKRTGTIEVVKNVIARKAIGAIATHDLEVCNTTNEYPDQLVNKCFEVEIIDNDLHFDYRLRDGICQNKSATFLMKKMGII